MSSGNNRTIGVVIAGLALAGAGAIFLIAGKAAVGCSMLAVGFAITAVGVGVVRKAGAGETAAAPEPITSGVRPGNPADR
jgi:hypothetical protein